MTVPGDLEPGSHRLSTDTEVSESRTGKGPRLEPRLLVLFSLLYAVQGVVVSYFLTFNGRYMTSPAFSAMGDVKGLTITQVGWSQSIATLPLAVKFLFGLWADRFSLLGLGYRRPYIMLGLLMQSFGLFGLSLIDPARHLFAFTLTAAIAVSGLCFYDVSCDAYAVQATPPEDRTRVQGILQASRFLSTAVCGVLFGLIWNLSAVGGQSVLWLCGLLPLPALVYTMTVPEPSRIRSPDGFGLEVLRMFRHRTLWGLLIFGVIYAVVSFGVEGVLAFWFAVPALAFTERALGLQSLGRNCGRAFGAIAQGRMSGRVSQRSLVVVGLVGLSAAAMLFGTVIDQISALFVGILFGFAVGWLDALACSMAMDEADPELPASSFSLIMAFQNLGILGTGLMNGLADQVGFVSAFSAAALVNLAALAAWPLIAVRPRKRSIEAPWSV